MKRITALMLICFAVGLTAALAQDSMKAPAGGSTKKQASGKEMTIKGEVVDVSCYLAHGSKGMGADHQACAEACAKNGSALGILPDLVFALNQDGLARAWRRNLHGGRAGGGKCEYQEPRPDAKHA